MKHACRTTKQTMNNKRYKISQGTAITFLTLVVVARRISSKQDQTTHISTASFNSKYTVKIWAV